MIVTENRVRGKSVDRSVPVGAASSRNCDLSVLPSVQPTVSGEPNTSVLVGYDGPYAGIRQPLVCTKCGDNSVAKAIEAASRAHPDIAFTIFKESVNVFP